MAVAVNCLLTEANWNLVAASIGTWYTSSVVPCTIWLCIVEPMCNCAIPRNPSSPVTATRYVTRGTNGRAGQSRGEQSESETLDHRGGSFRLEVTQMLSQVLELRLIRWS